MSRARAVLAPVPGHDEARWRSALAQRVRPEFRVERYLPARDHLVLYGLDCSVARCGRPGNELLVGPARLCQRHAQLWVKVRGIEIDRWLATAPAVRRRSEQTGMPRYSASRFLVSPA